LFQNPQLTHNVPTGYIALCPQCFDVFTLLSFYDSNDFMTIPFYCYLYLILHSLSLIWNEDKMDFIWDFGWLY